MEPYIHGKRNSIHIIDVKETVKGLLRAKKFLAKIVADGKDVLFVGTKRQARHAVEEETKRCGMHFVGERWLGGTLTNFATIRRRLNRLDELENLFTTGEIETYSKKMKSTLGREMKKIKANLEGIRKMEKMPGAMFIIDTRREHIAVKEAKKLGVPVVALIDTDGNPELIDLPVPGNDDAMKAVEIIMQELADAIIEAKGTRPAAKDDGQGGPRRRSARSSFKADEGAAPAGGEAPAAEAPAAEPAVAG